MTCSGCGKSYDEEKIAACEGCTLLLKGCGRSRCPYCGYENQLPLKTAVKSFRDRWRELLNGSRH